MRHILISSFMLFFLNYAFAKPGEAFEITLSRAISVDQNKIDPVGNKLVSLSEGHELQGNCEKRLENGDCAQLGFVLNYHNQKLALISLKTNSPVSISLLRIKERLNEKYLESLWSFQDFSSDTRQAGDFTGHLGVVCIYDVKMCPLLVLLPLAIAADIALLPIDIARNRIPQAKARNRAKKLIKGLSLPSEEETVVSDREFFKKIESFALII